MPKVGEAFYELTGKDAGLFAALGQAEGRMQASGAAAEKSFGGGVAKGMQTAEAAVAGGTTRMGSLMSSVSAPVQKLTGHLGDLKTGIVQGLGIGGFMAVSSAASEFIGKITASVGLASDLNETISKSNATFGPAAQSVLEWSKTTASSMGVAQASALDFASTFGGLLINFGIVPAKAAPMSQSLVKLAADMASFSNSTPEEALQALQSGLVGEVEPLRRFQVNLSQARTEQKAMELGLWDGKGAIDANAQAQARYAIIMQDTARQQGDFARTSSGLANQERLNAARTQEAWTRLGSALLPIANVVIPALANAGATLIDFMTSLLSHGREVMPILIGIGTVVAATIVPPFVAWAAATVIALAPLIAIAAAVAAVVFVLNQLGLLGPIIDAFWTLIGTGAKLVGDTFNSVFTIIRFVVSGIIGTIRNVIGIAAEIPGPWQDAAKSLKATLTDMQTSVDTWGQTTEDVAGKAGNVTPKTFADNMAAGAPQVAAAADTAITKPVVAASTTAKKEAVAIARATPGEIGRGLQAGKDAIASGADALKQAFKDHISPTKEIARLEGDLTGKLMQKGLHSNDPIIRAAALQWQTDIRDRLFVLKNNVGGWALTTGQNYADALGSKKAAVAAKANSLYTAARSSMSGVAGAGTAWGATLGVNYANGINSKGSYLYEKVNAYLKNAEKQMKASSPPREGPLHHIDDYAERTAQTYADSFAGQGGYLAQAVTGFLSDSSKRIRSFAPPALTPIGGLAAMAAAPSSTHTTSVTYGDIHVAINMPAAASQLDAGQVRGLARSLGEEIRMQITRNQPAFVVGS